MHNSGKRSKSLVLFGALGVGLVVLLWFSPIFIPFAYDYLVGDSVTSKHLQSVVGNESNSTQVAARLMGWIENSTRGQYAKDPTLYGPGWFLVPSSDGYDFFIRTNKASWVIFSKLGNCGEDAWYFAEMMNRSGYHARVLSAKGADHMFAEYQDESGTWIVVDPSNNLFVNDTLVWGWSPWMYVEAEDLSGNREVLTEQFVRNTSKVHISVDPSDRFSSRTRLLLTSTTLQNVSELYETPQKVLTHDFSENATLQVQLRTGADYAVTESVDLYVVAFVRSAPLVVTSDVERMIVPQDTIRLRNFRPTMLFLIVLIIILSIYLLLSRKNKLHA